MPCTSSSTETGMPGMMNIREPSRLDWRAFSDTMTCWLIEIVFAFSAENVT